MIIYSAQDEALEKWEETQREALQELSGDAWKLNPGRVAPGCLLIVAFGTRVKVFFYTPYTETPTAFEPDPNNEHSARIIADFADPDPSNHFFQPLPGPEPIDAREKDARERLEYCITALKDDNDNCYYFMRSQVEDTGANDLTSDNNKAGDVSDMEDDSMSDGQSQSEWSEYRKT